MSQVSFKDSSDDTELEVNDFFTAGLLMMCCSSVHVTSSSCIRPEACVSVLADVCM